MSNEETIEVKTRLKRQRKLRTAYNISQTDGSKIVAIRISGRYLEDLGFRHDGYFVLTINDDRSLTLRPCLDSCGVEDVEAQGQVD